MKSRTDVRKRAFHDMANGPSEQNGGESVTCVRSAKFVLLVVSLYRCFVAYHVLAVVACIHVKEEQ